MYRLEKISIHQFISTKEHFYSGRILTFLCPPMSIQSKMSASPSKRLKKMDQKILTRRLPTSIIQTIS